jgi:kynurenine formamidase
VTGYRASRAGPSDHKAAAPAAGRFVELSSIGLARTVDLPAVVVRVEDALADHGATLVGVDALNIDDTTDGERPTHTLLLSAGIPIVEHLTELDQLPPAGALFTAVPLRIEGFSSIPVRAFARLPG